MLLIIISTALISLIYGFFEAIYFDKNPQAAKEFNKTHKFEWHFYITIARALTFLPFVIYSFILHKGIDTTIITMAIIALPFPFFHDGMYYYTRNVLDRRVYPLRWLADSTTTTAKVSFSAFWRLIFLIFYLGLMPLVFMEYII